MFKQKLLQKLLLVITFSLVILLAGCGNNNLRPVEEEQIKNVVEDYLVRDTNIPEYEVEIAEVRNGWARVNVTLVRSTEAEMPARDVFYLQKQTLTTEKAPTAELQTQPGNHNQAAVTTSSGWTIILGPKTEFSPAELDAVGVPDVLRQRD